MQLNEDDITRFQELMKKHYHKDITRHEAMEQGTALVRFFQILLQAEARRIMDEKQH